MVLDDGYRTKECKVNKMSTNTFSIILTEGKNRQIRRMCEAVRINLLELSRIQFGPISIGTIKEGAYRELTDAEVDDLRKTAAV